MGNRVLFQCVSSRSEELNVPMNQKYGPVVYGHWSGDRAGEVVAKLKERMKGRENDVEYATARLVQILCGNNSGNLGFGCWNATGILTVDDSHGNAGVVLIDVGDGFKCKCLGGYLETDENGLPSTEAK